MADEPDQQYQPWLRDSGSAAAPVPRVPEPAKPPRRDVRALSADELLARPAPLPTDAPAGAGAVEKMKGGLDKVAKGLRAANERLEPGRRARAAGSAAAKLAGAAYRGTRKAAGAIGSATAQAASQATQAAAPKIHEAADAAIAGVAKTAASLRDGIGKGGKAARAGLGTGVARAKQRVRAALPERPHPVAPPSELERLVEREGLAGKAATPAPVRDGDRGLPLFGEGGAPSLSPPPVPDPAPVPKPAQAAAPQPVPVQPIAAATAVPPTAPPAEAMQAEAEPIDRVARQDSNGGVWSSSQLRDWARHPASWILAALALVASGFALGRWTGGSGMSEAALGEAIDAHLLANPEIVPQAMERLQANRQSQAIGQVRAALTTPFSGAWTGNAGGDVTMVVFTDYACTFCRASVPDIERLLRTDPNLKIVFRELPILSRESEAAARVALAAARRGRYMAVHRSLFRSQVPDAAARASALSAAGVAVDASATTDAAIDRELAANVELARTLSIDGTPAFVVGDRLMVGAVGYDALRAAIATARD
jgi:protein-disulfide isomerase